VREQSWFVCIVTHVVVYIFNNPHVRSLHVIDPPLCFGLFFFVVHRDRREDGGDKIWNDDLHLKWFYSSKLWRLTSDSASFYSIFIFTSNKYEMKSSVWPPVRQHQSLLLPEHQRLLPVNMAALWSLRAHREPMGFLYSLFNLLIDMRTWSSSHTHTHTHTHENKQITTF